MNIINEWNNLSSLVPKDKYEKIKELAHQIVEEVKNNQFAEADIDTYIKILNQAIKVSGFPQKYLKTQAMLISKKLVLSGDDKAEIVSKNFHVVNVEGGMISVGDPSIESSTTLNDFSNKSLLEITNQGKRLYFSTGGDGSFEVQLRIVKAHEPVLSEKEYKLVLGSTEMIILEVPSGVIAVGDIGSLDKSELKATVGPGNYKVCAYLFDTHNNFRAYYVVCTPTDLAATNTSNFIINLE
jgi:hypothetical protein